MREKLNTLPLSELKELARTRGLRGISGLRRALRWISKPKTGRGKAAGRPGVCGTGTCSGGNGSSAICRFCIFQTGKWRGRGESSTGSRAGTGEKCCNPGKRRAFPRYRGAIPP